MSETPNPDLPATTNDAAQPHQSWLVRRSILLPPGPARHLATSSAVNMLGTGLMSVSAVLYYTEVVGFSVAEVSLGIGLSTLIGMLGGAPVGRLADRRGPREIYLVTLMIQAAATAALVLVTNFWTFVLILTVTTLAQAGSIGARGPMLRKFAGPKQTHFRAYVHAAVNLTASIGLLISALAIELNTRTAYVILILCNAASYVATAIIIGRLPHVDPAGAKKPAGGKSKRTALRDRPFLAFTTLNAITSFQNRAMSFALPLWIVLHTHAPRWLISTSMVMGTTMVVVLQVRLSRGVDSNEGAARIWRRSGWALLIGMGLVGSSESRSAWLAAALIVGGILVMTIGEIQQSAGSFELRVTLASNDAQGEYAGVFNMGTSIANVIAPAVVSLFCVDLGAIGWWLMGGIFAACGLAAPGVVRWADRSQQREAESAEPVTA